MSARESGGRRTLPVADGARLRAYLWATARRHGRGLGGTALLHALATAASLVAPWLLGQIVDGVADGISPTRVNLLVAMITAALVAHSVLSYFAISASIRLGERILAELREGFVDSVLRLPLATVERAGTGDLVARTGRDVGHMSHVARNAVPETIIALVTLPLTVGAIALVNPFALLPALLMVPGVVAATRWYLRRAPSGYVEELASYTELVQQMTDTVEGARTVEALRRGERQRARTEASIGRAYTAERYTLWLRTVWLPSIETSYVLPLVATLLVGGWLHTQDLATLGQVTASVLYVQLLVGPMERMFAQLDDLMQGTAALRRLLGVRERQEHGPKGDGGWHGPARSGSSGAVVELAGVRFGYRSASRDVLRGIDLRVRPGERLALVGPSGSGKSTLARLLAGIHVPRAGEVLVGGTPIGELPLAEQRRRVALVTQETHVFLGSIGDNVAMVSDGRAAPERVWSALATVGAAEWVRELPEGLDTVVGSGGLLLDPARVQQLALARLVLADPPVVVLDEATSLFDPRSARQVERSLAAALRERTVVAIAHRLHTAHDADRVAVMEEGRITEMGAHEELLARGGPYAALWRTWHG